MSRAGRSRRSDDPASYSGLLASLGDARQALTRAQASMVINGPLYLAASAVTREIDGVALILTGDREHYWLRAHAAPGPKDGASSG